jgi:SAM-dependent methyltransferase
MPFADNSFDAAWSIWVLEHIPNPEKALDEMRRVIRPGGYLLLRPAYDVSRYAPKGYLVRPYSDFPWTERPMKAWAMLTDTEGFRSLERPQILYLRSLASSFGPTRLHFSKITPNYTDFWMADAGATTSVSYPEVVMWFTSRGDRCLNCASRLGSILSKNLLSGDGEPMMVMQINK